MTAQRQRLLETIDAEIKNLSKLQNKLARTKQLLQEHATRLRLGTSPELVMTSLRLSLPHETTLALMERVDPVLSGPAEPPPSVHDGLSGSAGVLNSHDDGSAGRR